ncbi:MAG: response regulator [Clostridia bacterium]|nr:response regulator [Clostridia bacterium]
MRFCIMTKNEEVKKDFEFISKEISDKKLFFIENDTQNALKDITTYDLDYIFTDISLPEVDGFDFIEDVKRKRSECKIIVISNVKNQTIVNMAREMGIIDPPMPFRQAVSSPGVPTAQTFSRQGTSSPAS